MNEQQSSGRGGLLLRVLAAVLLALLPVVAVAVSPWESATGAVLLGLLPVLSAAPSGLRSMAAALVATSAVALVAVLIGATGPWAPLLGTALVAGLGVATGFLSAHGLHPVGAATIMLGAQLLVDPTGFVASASGEAGPLGAAAIVAIAALLAGGWAIATTSVVLRGVRLPAGPQRATLPYGLLLAILCGGFMLVCMVWFRGTNAWWSVMTIALVLQPTRTETLAKVGGRIGGTVLGGVVAAALVLWMPYDAVRVGALIAVGLASAMAAVVLLLVDAAYWAYAFAVTVSVVLLTFDGESVIEGDLQRIAATVLAGAATAIAVSVAGALLPRRSSA